MIGISIITGRLEASFGPRLEDFYNEHPNAELISLHMKGIEGGKGMVAIFKYLKTEEIARLIVETAADLKAEALAKKKRVEAEEVKAKADAQEAQDLADAIRKKAEAKAKKKAKLLAEKEAKQAELDALGE